MIDYIFYFALTIVMAIGCVAFGIAIGCKIGKKEETRTEDFFLRRDAYRRREKELKKQLAEKKAIADSLHKDNIALRLQLGEASDEIAELRFKIRRADSAKERANHD